MGCMGYGPATDKEAAIKLIREATNKVFLSSILLRLMVKKMRS